MTMRKLFFAILLSFFSLFFIQNVQALCIPSQSNVSFGTVNSFAIQTSQQEMVSTTMGLTCTNIVILDLLTQDKVTATIKNNSGFMLSNNSSNSIPYKICKDVSCNDFYENQDSIIWNSTQLIALLSLGQFTVDLPLYLKILPTTNTDLIAETYTDTIEIQWDWSLCTLGVAVCLARDKSSATSTVNLTLTVSKICEINSAPNVEFGSAALPSSFNAINSNVLQTRCTKNANYSIKLTSIQSEIDGMRQMLATVNGSNYYLQYQLYRSGVAWTSINDVSLIGTGSTQSIPYTAEINASQPNLPAGSYSDTIKVTVTY